MAFYLYTGNKLKKLAKVFREEIYSKKMTPDTLLTPETVVVQSRGIEAWLRQELAQSSIAAGLDCPFVNNFIESVLNYYCGDGDDFNGLNRRNMTWEIFRLFIRDSQTCPEAEKYFYGDKNSDNGNTFLRKYQLAEKLAELFDQYQIYHGEELAKWRKGEYGSRHSWIGRIYSLLAEKSKGIDRYFEEFARKIFRNELPETHRRVSVFGISSMPESHLKFFINLSKIWDVHFFYLTPCQDYWSDVLTEKQAKVLRKKLNLTPEELPPSGNQLLAALGVQGRNFHVAILENMEQTDITEKLCFEESPKRDMLHLLQLDLQNNTLCGYAADKPEKRFKTDGKDRSITVHNCHSALRETEVLHDRLLHLIQERHIQPHEMIVMAPDIGTYEPYIRAVFENGPLKKHYALCDRAIRRSNSAAAALMAMLKLAQSKYEVTAVLDLLEYPVLKISSTLTDGDMEKIRTWASEAEIRWGVDSKSRKDFCEVDFEEYSWKQGLNRLLLGYAQFGGDAEDSDIIPLAPGENDDAVMLGDFVFFVNELFDLRDIFTAPKNEKTKREKKTVSWWVDKLTEILDKFFVNTEDYLPETRAVRSAIQEIAAHNEILPDEEFPPELIIYLLDRTFGENDAADPFLCGKITFCSLMPMRSIPMKAIAILGLNDGAFPRKNIRPGFDVVLRSKDRLDKSPDLEDRFLFLEAIMAAEENLMLFYQGRDSKENVQYPPCVPLEELMEQIRLTFELPENCGVEIKHKLQAFDPDYFSGRHHALFSYSEENFEGADAFYKFNQSGEDKPAEPLRNALPELKDETVIETLELEKLEAFFLAPQEFYLRHNAELNLRSFDSKELSDEEPSALRSYERRNLIKDIADWEFNGKPPEQYRNILQKTSRLPVGELGKMTFSQAEKDLQSLDYPDKIRETVQTEPTELTVTLAKNKLTLTGKLPILNGNSYYYWQGSEFYAENALRWYLRHLLLAAARKEAVSYASFLSDKLPVNELKGISREEAIERLEKLTECYRKGHSTLLPFFPAAAYACAVHGGDWKKVRTAFYDVITKPVRIELGDYTGKAVAMFFSPDDFNTPDSPLMTEFSELAKLVFAPFVKEKAKGKKRGRAKS